MRTNLWRRDVCRTPLIIGTYIYYNVSVSTSLSLQFVSVRTRRRSPQIDGQAGSEYSDLCHLIRIHVRGLIYRVSDDGRRLLHAPCESPTDVPNECALHRRHFRPTLQHTFLW